MRISATHWLDAARHCPSPFFNQRPQAEISLTVIHNISLPPSQFGGPFIEQLFLGTLNASEHPYFAEIHRLEVSSHLLIRRDAEVIQFVAFDQRAWHAGRSQYLGRDNCNDFSIGIELEGSDDLPFEDAQYERLALVIKTLWQHYPESKGRLVGHSEIAPGRKTDPGPFFDWPRLNQLLAERR